MLSFRRIFPVSAAALAALAVACVKAPAGPPSAAADTEAEAAARVEARYGSIPKGVTLEGEASGFSPVTHVQVQRIQDPLRGPQARFVLNGGPDYYEPPVSPADMGALLAAFSQDSNARLHVGVTLMPNGDFQVYGRLDKRSQAARDIAEADRVLGGIVHASPEYLRSANLPPGFQPQRAQRRQVQSAARFNFTDYEFGRSPPELARLHRIRYTPDLRLTPVIIGAARDGGHRRDEARLAQGIHGEPEDVANFSYLRNNLEWFIQNNRPIGRAVDLGEAAAFARYLKRQGVDLAALARQL